MIAPLFSSQIYKSSLKFIKLAVCTIINEICKVLIWNSIMFSLMTTDWLFMNLSLIDGTRRHLWSTGMSYNWLLRAHVYNLSIHLGAVWNASAHPSPQIWNTELSYENQDRLLLFNNTISNHDYSIALLSK